MHYGRIFYCDIANGVGCRTALFVSGCTHHCKECFNPETWDFQYGEPFTEHEVLEILDSLAPVYVDGLSLLGGEPMEKENQPVIYDLLVRMKERYPKKSVWIYSGYTFEELTDSENARCHTEYTKSILEMTDILVDGEVHIEEKNISLRFRGSENQRIIDVPKTLETGSIVLSEYMKRVR